VKIEVKNLKVGDIFYMTNAFTTVRKYRVDLIVGKTDCPVVRTSEWSKDKGKFVNGEVFRVFVWDIFDSEKEVWVDALKKLFKYTNETIRNYQQRRIEIIFDEGGGIK